MKIQLLKDITTEIKPGPTLTRFKIKEEEQGEIIKVFSIQEMNQDSIYLSDEIGEEMKVKDASLLEKFLLKKGDVIITTRGSAIKAAAFHGVGNVVANGNITIIKCNKNILPEYLTIFLKSESTIHELQKKTAGLLMLSISVSALGNLKVPVPSIEMQEKIVNLFKELETYTSARTIEINNVKTMVLQKIEQLIHN